MDATGTSVLVAAGVLIPFIVSYLKDVSWSLKVKQALSFGIATAFGVGVTVVDKGVSIDSVPTLLANLGVIFTTAQVFYVQLLKGSEVNAKLENSGVGAGKAE